MIERNRLGETGIEVTRLAMGGASIGGLYGPVAEADALAALERALEVGINYIDTSPLYRESERILGEALRKYDRGSYVLSTKVGTHADHYGDFSAETTRWSLENSARLLGTDWFDMVLIHDPTTETIDQALGPGGALEELLRWKDAGRIKAIGTGLYWPELHLKAMETGKIDVLLTFQRYNLCRQTNEELVRTAVARGAGVINAAVLDFGLMSGEDPRSVVARTGWPVPEENVQQLIALRSWAQERGIDFAKLAIEFSLRCPLFLTTLVGFSKPSEVDGALRAVYEPESEETWGALKAEFPITEMR